MVDNVFFHGLTLTVRPFGRGVKKNCILNFVADLLEDIGFKLVSGDGVGVVCSCDLLSFHSECALVRLRNRQQYLEKRLGGKQRCRLEKCLPLARLANPNGGCPGRTRQHLKGLTAFSIARTHYDRHTSIWRNPS